MSAQCWCFSCAGMNVTRKTYCRHGRKDKPDAPITHPQLAVLSMPDSKDNLVTGNEESDDDIANNDSDSDHDPFGLACEDPDAVLLGKAQITSPEVTLLLRTAVCAWFWTPLPSPSPL